MEGRYQHVRKYWMEMPISSSHEIKTGLYAVRRRYESTIAKLCRNYGQEGDYHLTDFLRDTGKELQGVELRNLIYSDQMCTLCMDVITIMVAFAYSIPMHSLMDREGVDGHFCRLLSRKIFSGLEQIHTYLYLTRRKNLLQP
jgi:hypothetical protein